ncbi:hypothetical protein NEOKW01_1468 [Nematocida sp. AWRm80]|nr:hypothetical protein NEOKW01_1468 [Nematocida sp. AWRm80]
MLKRVLQDITNVQNKNIKIVIKREEKGYRSTIPRSYLEYLDTFYSNYNNRILSKIEYTEENISSNIKDTITMEMRNTLIEWLYDIKTDYKLNSSIFQTAVRIVDLYSGNRVIKRSEYQLVGIVSFCIAVKLISTHSTRINMYLDLCDGAYTLEEFLNMEKEILIGTGYNLNYLLPMHIIKEDHLEVGNALCIYSSEVYLLDIEYIHKEPIEIGKEIEREVVKILETTRVSKWFYDLLTKSATMLEQQSRSIKDIINRLSVE